MIKKLTIILLLPLALISCTGLGSGKIKNIVELTPTLAANGNEKIEITPLLKELNYQEVSKQKSYKISNAAMIGTPCFYNNAAYLIDAKSVVYAFSVIDKKIEWSQNIGNKAQDQHFMGGGIAYNQGKLYITNGSRFLITLDAKTGYEIARKEFPDIIRIEPVVLYNDVILVQTISNQLFAFDAIRSKVIWQHEVIAETLTSSNYIKPVIHQGNVIVNYSSGQIFALDAKGGEEQWGINLFTEFDVTLPGFEPSTLSCPPVVQGKHLYFASGTNKLFKIDLTTGGVIWEIKATDIQSISLEGNNLFITTNARQIAAISLGDGKIKWVGELDLEKIKRKTRTTHFLPPFATNFSEGNFAVNVVASSGQIYTFFSDKAGNLSSEPKVTKTIKNLKNINISCCLPGMALSGEKTLIFY